MGLGRAAEFMSTIRGRSGTRRFRKEIASSTFPTRATEEGSPRSRQSRPPAWFCRRADEVPRNYGANISPSVASTVLAVASSIFPMRLTNRLMSMVRS